MKNSQSKSENHKSGKAKMHGSIGGVSRESDRRPDPQSPREGTRPTKRGFDERQEALDISQKNITDAMAELCDRLAEVTAAMSRAGATAQRLNEAIGQIGENWSTAPAQKGKTPENGWEPGKNLARATENAGSSSSELAGQMAEETAAQSASTQAARGPSSSAPSPEQPNDLPRPMTTATAKHHRPRDLAQPPDSTERGSNCPAGTDAPRPFANLSRPSERESAFDESAQREAIKPQLFEPASPRNETVGTGQNDAIQQTVPDRSLVDKLSRGDNLESAQAQYLRLLEQTITNHQRTLDQAVKLIDAQSANASFTLSLLEHAHTRVEAFHARLEQLEAQSRARTNFGASG